jgi:hypothetical protein
MLSSGESVDSAKTSQSAFAPQANSQSHPGLKAPEVQAAMVVAAMAAEVMAVGVMAKTVAKAE